MHVHFTQFTGTTGTVTVEWGTNWTQLPFKGDSLLVFMGTYTKNEEKK